MTKQLIFEQIPKIMADIKPIGKNQYNQGQRFNFRGIDDVYNSIQSVLAKHKVFTTSEILHRNRQSVTTRNGGQAYHCVNSFRFTFFAADGSSVTFDADGEAMDSGDKATAKCAAIAHKYALLQMFCIPTQETIDPDGESFEISSDPKKVIANPNVIGTVSQKQVGRLYSIAKAAGMRNEDCNLLVQQKYNCDPTALTKVQYDDICNSIQNKTSKLENSGDNLF